MTKRIKVAFLEGSSKIGGAEINVLNLIQRMDQNKFETVVICPCEGPFTDRVREIGGKAAVVSRLPLFSTSAFIRGKKITNPFAIIYNLLSFIPSSFLLAKFIRHKKIDVLHTNSMLAHFYGGMAARIARVPCLWHMQDIVDDRQMLGLLRSALNWVGNWLPHRIIVVSNAVRMMFRNGAKQKAYVVYNGTDLKKYFPNRPGYKVRAELGIPTQEIVVGIVGRIVHWKGHKEFLYAAKGIHNDSQDTTFLIVGDASFGNEEYFDQIKKLAQDLGLEKAAIFTGFRKDVPSVIAAMDICVHSSNLPDPCPLVIFDYMASGKPVIATSGGGVPEIVIDGKTGILVPMKDSMSLTEAIQRLIGDPKERSMLGATGRKRVEDFFTIEHFVKAMSAHYRELAYKHRDEMVSWKSIRGADANS